MLAGLLCSLPAYPVDNTSKHLEKLQILIDHNLPYDREMSSDSIILLEKEPQESHVRLSSPACSMERFPALRLQLLRLSEV